MLARRAGRPCGPVAHEMSPSTRPSSPTSRPDPTRSSRSGPDASTSSTSWSPTTRVASRSRGVRCSPSTSSRFCRSTAHRRDLAGPARQRSGTAAPRLAARAVPSLTGTGAARTGQAVRRC